MSHTAPWTSRHTMTRDRFFHAWPVVLVYQYQGMPASRWRQLRRQGWGVHCVVRHAWPQDLTPQLAHASALCLVGVHHAHEALTTHPQVMTTAGPHHLVLLGVVWRNAHMEGVQTRHTPGWRCWTPAQVAHLAGIPGGLTTAWQEVVGPLAAHGHLPWHAPMVQLLHVLHAQWDAPAAA